MKIIALIPARGGSKGLPGKNIITLAGQPLIAYSIKEAKKCKYLDRIVVSTDDADIARVARKYGAEAPFLRPKELAKDTSPTIDAILHALDWFEDKGEKFDLFVLLEPTSPLREETDITKSIEILLENKKAKSIVGIAKLESAHPEFNLILNKEGFIRRWTDKSGNFRVLRRQDLTDVYFFEGTIYVSYVKTLREKRSFYHGQTLGYVVPRYKSLEIDDIYDLKMAEAIIKYRRKNQNKKYDKNKKRN